MVKKHAVLRRASGVALESNAQKNPSSAAEFVKYSKSMIEFQVIILLFKDSRIFLLVLFP